MSEQSPSREELLEQGRLKFQQRREKKAKLAASPAKTAPPAQPPVAHVAPPVAAPEPRPPPVVERTTPPPPAVSRVLAFTPVEAPVATHVTHARPPSVGSVGSYTSAVFDRGAEELERVRAEAQRTADQMRNENLRLARLVSDYQGRITNLETGNNALLAEITTLESTIQGHQQRAEEAVTTRQEAERQLIDAKRQAARWQEEAGKQQENARRNGVRASARDGQSQAGILEGMFSEGADGQESGAESDHSNHSRGRMSYAASVATTDIFNTNGDVNKMYAKMMVFRRETDALRTERETLVKDKERISTEFVATQRAYSQIQEEQKVLKENFASNVQMLAEDKQRVERELTELHQQLEMISNVKKEEVANLRHEVDGLNAAMSFERSLRTAAETRAKEMEARLAARIIATPTRGDAESPRAAPESPARGAGGTGTTAGGAADPSAFFANLAATPTRRTGADSAPAPVASPGPARPDNSAEMAALMKEVEELRTTKAALEATVASLRQAADGVTTNTAEGGEEDLRAQLVAVRARLEEVSAEKVAASLRIEEVNGYVAAEQQAREAAEAQLIETRNELRDVTQGRDAMEEALVRNMETIQRLSAENMELSEHINELRARHGLPHLNTGAPPVLVAPPAPLETSPPEVLMTPSQPVELGLPGTVTSSPIGAAEGPLVAVPPRVYPPVTPTAQQKPKQQPREMSVTFSLLSYFIPSLIEDDVESFASLE